MSPPYNTCEWTLLRPFILPQTNTFLDNNTSMTSNFKQIPYSTQNDFHNCSCSKYDIVLRYYKLLKDNFFLRFFFLSCVCCSLHFHAFDLIFSLLWRFHGALFVSTTSIATCVRPTVASSAEKANFPLGKSSCTSVSNEQLPIFVNESKKEIYTWNTESFTFYRLVY